MSAPVSPTVPSASRCMSTSSASGTFFVCTSNNAIRAFWLGRSTVTWRSKRPGRRSAGSSTSGRFVAASTITDSVGLKPSISLRIWLSVCSRSSWPPPSPAPRIRPTASISSMNKIAGEASLAVLNRSRTRDAPTPTNIWINSLPEMEKNGTPASPATARARRVFPVPGGPIKRTPLGTRPPSLWNFLGSFKNSTISLRSSFTPSSPATSANVDCLSSVLNRLAGDLVKLPRMPDPPSGSRARRMEIQKAPMSKRGMSR